MSQLTPETRQKYYRIFNEVSSSTKLPLLRQLTPYELHLLYTLGAELMSQLYRIEFDTNFDELFSAEYLRAFFTAYRRHSDGAISEEKFLKALCYDLMPILYCAEVEEKLTTLLPVDKETLLIFLVDFLNSLVKGIPNSRKVELKTAELKRYSKTRLDLDEADYILLSAAQLDEKEDILVTKACVFQVNRLRVLCGFFSETGEWRSEKYVPEETLSALLLKYDLVRRNLD